MSATKESSVEVHDTCGQPVGRLPQRLIGHPLDYSERRWCGTCGLNTSLWSPAPSTGTNPRS